MDEDAVRYHHARRRLHHYVAELGGVLRDDDIEASICENERTVMLMVEVRPDEYAIAEFELANRVQNEEEFVRKWRSQEAVHH